MKTRLTFPSPSIWRKPRSPSGHLEGLVDPGIGLEGGLVDRAEGAPRSEDGLEGEAEAAFRILGTVEIDAGAVAERRGAEDADAGLRHGFIDARVGEREGPAEPEVPFLLGVVGVVDALDRQRETGEIDREIRDDAVMATELGLVVDLELDGLGAAEAEIVPRHDTHEVGVVRNDGGVETGKDRGGIDDPGAVREAGPRHFVAADVRGIDLAAEGVLDVPLRDGAGGIGSDRGDDVLNEPGGRAGSGARDGDDRAETGLADADAENVTVVLRGAAPGGRGADAKKVDAAGEARGGEGADGGALDEAGARVDGNVIGGQRPRGCPGR